MGFSTSAVVVIFTASLIYIATIYYPLANMSYHRVIRAEKNLNEMQYEKLNTKIVITNTQVTGGDLVVTVYNNGSLTLNSSKLNVVYNGALTPSFTVSNPGVWTPKSSIDLTISHGANNSRVKIVAANGAADYAVT